MAGRGPAPKPAHLRQRTNRKAGATTLSAVENPEIPEIPNPDQREWHPLTLVAWQHAWESPMSAMWLDVDADGVGRLALLWDWYYKTGSIDALKEIRLQSPSFGLTPLDRSRLQWEVERGDAAERKAQQRAQAAKPVGDPRKLLKAV